MDDEVDRKKASPVARAPEHFFGRVLSPEQLLEHASYSTPREVAQGLRPFVKRYWAVEWDLPAGASHQAATVSEPTVNLTLEYGTSRRRHTDGPGAWVTGPVTQRRFDVGIWGRGGVVGVNFHLGATLAFSDRSPSGIRDAVVSAAQWFPSLETDLGLAESLSRPPDVSALAESVENWLLSRRPRMSPGYMRLKHALDVLDDPEVVSLRALSQRTGIGERTLQRMFDRYCGVGVKKILARARIIDAVGALDRGWDGSLAELGAQYGWFDQSHFGADFLSVTGCSPGEYARRSPTRFNRG